MMEDEIAKRNTLEATVETVLDHLTEQFISVQIIAVYFDEESGFTLRVCRGRGEWYSRCQIVRLWLETHQNPFAPTTEHQIYRHKSMHEAIEFLKAHFCSVQIATFYEDCKCTPPTCLVFDGFGHILTRIGAAQDWLDYNRSSTESEAFRHNRMEED